VSDAAGNGAGNGSAPERNAALRAALATASFANVLLTAPDATTGATPKDRVWHHRKTTLYRYRSRTRQHAVPILLVFALINRSYIYDLRPGASFVEYLLERGHDVWVLDWGEPGDEDADLGLDYYVCRALPGALRELRRATGAAAATLVGWCIGGTLCAMYAALNPDGPVRNLVLLTAPVDVSDNALYQRWTGRDDYRVERMTDAFPAVPGPLIDVGNKLLKPVTNGFSTYRSLWYSLYEGTADVQQFKAFSKWVNDSPAFPGRAYREWITWMYKENRLPRDRVVLGGRRVRLCDIDQRLLVVTATKDHIAPRPQTVAIMDLVSSEDRELLEIPGGHVGLMAGSRARSSTWPLIADWLEPRSS
jgi:polyhydroxyalkanoate synthase